MPALTDRLLDFSRAENLGLLSEFETLRAEVLAGDLAVAREHCARLQERLAAHVHWEEDSVYPEFARRCHPGDREALRDLTDDHDFMVRMLYELALMIEQSEASPAAVEVIEDLDSVMYDHRLREEADVCAPLDHVLDGPTRERIERAHAPDPEDGK